MTKDIAIKEEVVIREYPDVTVWLKFNRTRGTGNLILSNQRLIFLYRVALADWQLEKIRNLSNSSVSQVLDFSLKLHGKNFQLPLERITGVKLGMFFPFPFPRLCLHVLHRGQSKKVLPPEVDTFWFKAPLLKTFLQFDLTLIWGWILTVRKAIKTRKAQTNL